MPTLLLAALSLVLGYTALRQGGVAPADLNTTLLTVALLAGYYAFRPHSFAPPPGGVLRWPLVALPVLFAIQIVPLPPRLVQWISPARFELSQAATPVLGAPHRIPLSAAPAATLQALTLLTGCLLILLLVRELAWRFEARPWIPAVPLLAIAALEASLAQVQPQARGTFVNRNHFASMLAMCLPFALAWALALLARHLRRREIPALPVAGACALFGLAALLMAAVVRSGSRMGFLAALLALGVAATAVSRGRGAALAVALLAAAAFVLLPTDALIERFSELASGDVSNQTRLLIWRDTLPLIRNYPVAGCGLGAYAPVFLRYQTAAPLQTVDFAHNDYLQLLAEGGLAGCLPAAIAVALILASAARGCSPTLGRDRACRSAACLGALAALLFHSAFDFSLHIPANAMVAAWIAGLATAPAPGKFPSGPPFSPLVHWY